MPRGYPLFLPACAAVLGVCGAYLFGLTPSWQLSLAFGALLAGLVWLLTGARSIGRATQFLLGISSALLLGLGSAARHVEEADAASVFVPRDGRSQAEVLKVSGLNRRSARPAHLRILKVGDEPLSLPCRLWGYVPPGTVRGDIIEFKGTVRPLQKGDYWEGLLAASGVAGRVSIGGLEKRGSRFSIGRCLYGCRAWLSDRFEGRAYGELFQGLILGDSRSLDPEVYLRAREGGTVHVLVVSGLHVGIAGAMAMWLGQLLGLRIRARNLLAIAVTLAYALLAGFGTSAFRAWVMFSLLVASPLLRREYDTVNSLAAAALVIALVRPQDVISRGFALSLAAIAGILVAAELMTYVKWERLSAYLRRPLQGLCISTGAWLGVAPVSACFFGVLNLFAPLLSLLAVPVLGLFILAGWFVLIGEALSGLLPAARVLRFILGADGPVYWAASGLGWVLDAILDARGLGRFGLLPAWGPSPIWLALYCAALAVGIIFLREHRHLSQRLPESIRRGPWRRVFFTRALAPAFMVLLAVWPLVAEIVSGPEEGLYFFAAGKGEALAAVDDNAGIFVLSAGLPSRDTRLRRALRRSYRTMYLHPRLRFTHGEYEIESSPTGRVVWITAGERLIAWSLARKKALDEAAARSPLLIVHTGRVSRWEHAGTYRGCSVTYASSRGGVLFLPKDGPARGLTRP